MMNNQWKSLGVCAASLVVMIGCATTPNNKETTAEILKPLDAEIVVFDPVIDKLKVSINGVGKRLEGPMVWEWGDGSATQSWFPATHTYATPGKYSISVMDGEPRTKPLARIENLAVSNAALSTEDLRNIHRLSLNTPEVHSKQVSVNGVVVAPVEKIQWNWGDGSIDAHHWFPATHTYAQAGEYIVQVTTLDDQKRVSSQAVRLVIQ